MRSSSVTARAVTYRSAGAEFAASNSSRGATSGVLVSKRHTSVSSTATRPRTSRTVVPSAGRSNASALNARGGGLVRSTSLPTSCASSSASSWVSVASQASFKDWTGCAPAAATKAAAAVRPNETERIEDIELPTFSSLRLLSLTPYGIEMIEALAALARQQLHRSPTLAQNFFAAHEQRFGLGVSAELRQGRPFG